MAEPVLASPPSQAGPLRVGLIGFGYWGKKLHGALRQRPEFDLRHVHVRSPEQLDPEELRSLQGVELSDRSSPLWSDSELQAVILATPIASHYALCREALLAGKHVLVEKPLALTEREARELADLAASRGLTLQTDYTWTFSPGLLRIRQLVEQEWIGRLQHIQLRFHQLGRFREDDVGPLLAVHMLSILTMFTSLAELHWTKRIGVGNQQRASSILLYGEDSHSGLSVMLDGSLDDPVRERSVVFFGESGTLSFRPLSADNTLQGVRYSREPSTDDEVQPATSLSLCTAEDDNLSHSLSAFAEAICGRAPSNIEQSLAITATLEQLFAPAVPQN